MDRIFDVLGLLALSGVFTFIDIHNNNSHSLPTKSNAITGVPAGLVGMSCRHVVCVLQ